MFSSGRSTYRFSMRYALTGCTAAAAIIGGGMTAGAAAAAVPLEPAPPATGQPSGTGHPIFLTPFTGSAECWFLGNPTHSDCSSEEW